MRNKFTFIIIFFLSLFLMLSGVIGINYLKNSSNDLNLDLNHVYKQLEEGNFSEAYNLSYSAYENWKEMEIMWHILIDHKEIEKVENNFPLLLAHCKNENQGDAINALLALQSALLRIPQTESICIENIF